MFMATQLKSKVLKLKNRGIHPINESVKIWQEFTCTFTQSPTANDKRIKKAAFKAKMKAFLAKHHNDKKFAITVHWIKTDKPLVFRALVLIWQKDAPTGSPVATPMPPPPAPPAL
jgi:hypothetical protein